MSILRDENCEWFQLGSKAADFCFYCHGPLTIPCIYWAGGSPNAPASDGSELWLHPECVKPLTAGLGRDIIELHLGKEAANQWIKFMKEAA
jgi:hypothetical protein